MYHIETVIGIFPTHRSAGTAMKGSADAGSQMTDLSLVGKGHHSDEEVLGFRDSGDRIKSCGLSSEGMVPTIPVVGQGWAIEGFTLEARDGKVGIASDFLFDGSTRKLRWLAVDASTWLAGRMSPIHPSAVDKADLPASAPRVELTRDQVEKSPMIAAAEPVLHQMEAPLDGYRGVDSLWGGAYRGGNAIAAPTAEPDLNRNGGFDARLDDHAKGDKHLRSPTEVTGYDIHASDGQAGHVERFLIDDETWDIRYLVADTRNWCFGRYVLPSPASVREIMWDQHGVPLNLTRYKIKGCPACEPTSRLDHAYEHMPQAYFGWPDSLVPEKHAHEPSLPITAPVHVDAVS